MPTGNTQQQINYGASANDGQGDPLRTAFIKTDENFDNIWLAGPVGSNVRITNNTIGVLDTNGNLILSPNGVGVIQTNNHVVPRLNRTYDLGSANLTYRTVYANTATFQTLSIPGDLSVGGNLTVQGNIIQVGNIVTETLTIQLANAATTGNAANGAGITVGANDNIATLIYNSTSNVWTTNIGVSATGNITAPYFIGNGSQLTGITSYANANAVAYGQAGWAGNIIPSGNAVYSLGNATNQWNDLYVSNATIYMNNIPLSMTAGNVLTVNGQPVLSNNSNTAITTTGNITANYFIGDGSQLTGISSTGNLDIVGTTMTIAAGADETNISISPNGESQAYLQIPDNNTANVANVRMHNDAGNIELGTGGGSYLLYLDNTGNVTMPNGGYINFVNTGGIKQVVNEDFYIRGSDDEEDGWSIYNIIDDGAGNQLTKTQLQYNRFSVYTDVSGNNYSFDFREGGEFDVPKSIRGPVGGNLVISIGDQPGSNTFIDLQTRSYVGDGLISNVRIANPNVTVSTSSGAHTWTFDGTGNLNLASSGMLVGVTPNNNGHINWVGNSSGDGNGYTTMILMPDDTREAGDQYLILDPTAPGHIHIRAGGTQDNSNADLFLGGENSYFKVTAGANSEVRISANSHGWVFGTDSILTVPGEGIIRSIQDTVILQSYDISGNTYSARLGTNGGLYFETTEYPAGWLNLTNNAGNANISSPGGSINIDSADGTSGAAGKDINITAGDADQTDYYTTAGGDVNIQGGMGAFNDGGGGGPGGDINLVAGTSADPAGHAGNITVTSGTWNWQFINNGNLYVPGQINGDNNGNLIIDGAGYGNGYISLPAGSFGGEQVYIVNDFSLGNGIALTTNGGTWHFGNSGVLVAPGAITATGTVSGQILVSTQSATNEGGEIQLALPSSGTTLTGNIIIDSYQNSIRFFESTASRGLFVDVPNVSVSGQYAIGYRDVPQIALSGNVTANSITAGKHFYSTTAGNLQVTIPDNANVAFPLGATLTIVMNAAGNVIVAQGTGVSLYMAGSSSTGNRTVGAYGLASVMKVATDTWVISGTGVY